MTATNPTYPSNSSSPFPMPYSVAVGRILEPQPEECNTYLQTTIIKGQVPSNLDYYSPQSDVETVYKACHGAGTDNKMLTKALIKLGSEQMQVLQVAYKQQRQKDIIALIESETSGVYRTGLVLLVSGALRGDAYLLQQALRQNQENMLAIFIELVVGRSKQDLATLREYVSAVNNINLDQTILEALPKDNLALKQSFRKCLLEGVSTRGYDVEREVATLKKFFDSKTGEHYSDVLDIILDSPEAHLRSVASAYKSKYYDVDLSAAIIRSSIDKATQKVLLYAVLSVEEDGEGLNRDARRINAAIEERNELLLTIRLVRAHWYLARFQRVIVASDFLRPGKGSLLIRVSSLTAGWHNRNLRKLLKGIIKVSAPPS
ncbi:hypothetical protein FRC15_009224 [Serendipita sp. 397]|nr:hypothetical protein FRC16_001879 [Serendipita sp. 398]KAG8787410.1 hypothetical protein FRC15_009224 [Serendipita sp. 397]